MHIKRRFSVVVCALVLALSVHSQVPTGSMDGIIKDPNGRVVQGARITVTDDQRGTTRSSASNSDGSFTIPDFRREATRFP